VAVFFECLYVNIFIVSKPRKNTSQIFYHYSI